MQLAQSVPLGQLGQSVPLGQSGQLASQALKVLPVQSARQGQPVLQLHRSGTPDPMNHQCSDTWLLQG